MATEKQVHEKFAKHFGGQAQTDAKMAKCFSGMAKAADDADSAVYQAIAEALLQSMQQNADQSSFHESCVEDCMKAEADALNKIVPDGISAIGRVDAPETAFGIRAVPRHGQPTDGEDFSKNVPPVFRHLVSGGDEN